METERKFKFFGLVVLALLLSANLSANLARAEDEELKVIGPASDIDSAQPSPTTAQAKTALNNNKYIDPLKYTLGADDVIEITVMRHSEFSGVYPVNQEGKIQYKFVGDIDVTGLTKAELEQKIKEVISTYVVNPEINVTILEYKSKVIYILGEVGQPGKYYMKSDSVSVREAVVNAGLPTLAAAMRRCRLITPDKTGNAKTKSVDLYSVLYGGNLQLNIDMHPGEVLYVPATVMAKIVRVINPITSAVGITTSGPSDVSAAKSALTTLAK